MRRFRAGPAGRPAGTWGVDEIGPTPEGEAVRLRVVEPSEAAEAARLAVGWAFGHLDIDAVVADARRPRA